MNDGSGRSNLLKPGGAGNLVLPPAASAPVFHAHPVAALSMTWHLYLLNVDVLGLVTSPELETLTDIQGFDGLFSFVMRNVSRPRVWLPRMELVAVDVDAMEAMQS